MAMRLMDVTERGIQTNITLRQDQRMALGEIAQTQKVALSVLVRDAIDFWLESKKEDAG